MEGETKYERMAATATAVTYEDSDDDEFRPREDEEEEEEEATFTAEDYEAERPADDDDERDAYLAREIQGTASGEGVDDAPVETASASVTAGGRPRRGAAVRASEAIREAAKKRADAAQSRTVSRLTCPVAIAVLLALIVPLFVYSLYYPVHAPLEAGIHCGKDSNQFARELNAHKYTEALQYSKAPYATDSALVNVDEIGNVLFGKRASQPAVLLFVSSDSSDRKRVMNDFVDGLARIYYNASINPAAVKFTSGPKHYEMKQHIIKQLANCRRGLFAVDADVLLDHFDFMETALEDGVSYIEYENNERVYTGDSTFIIMDTLKEELIRRFLHDPATDRGRAKAAIATQVMAKHGPAWSKRFTQRVQDVFVF